MSNNSKTVSLSEKKEKIKNYFVEVVDDKFTKVRAVKCKDRIQIDCRSLLVESKHRQEQYNKIFKLYWDIDYRHINEIDSIFFTFSSVLDSYVGLDKLKIYLILDDNKTIELSNVSNYDKSSSGGIMYLEAAQLSVSIPEIIAMASAKKIEYSIRFSRGKVDGTLANYQMKLFKGFYNNTFDADFEVDTLYAMANIREKMAALEGGKGGCYIATMAYGSYEHPQVLFLRNFRDNYLAKKNWGKQFTSFYYKHSPSLVEKLNNWRTINLIIRKMLDLFIHIIKASK